MSEEQFKTAFQAIQTSELQSPSTRSVLTVGEDALSKSIQRLGQIDFFSVVGRKPRICDYKPVVVEVALARFLNRGDADQPIQLLRFANRVPLQFDKSACAITAAVESVNWKSYGLMQPKDSLPIGPYVFAISVVSPFIKFKNASKETIDASDELVEEIRRALMQAGQKLSRHIRKESREADLERKLQHIEQFGPILVEGLARLINAGEQRKKRAEEGLKKLLGRDTTVAENQLAEAKDKLARLKGKDGPVNSDLEEGSVVEAATEEDIRSYEEESAVEVKSPKQGTKKSAAPASAPKRATKKAASKPKTTGKKIRK